MPASVSEWCRGIVSRIVCNVLDFSISGLLVPGHGQIYVFQVGPRHGVAGGTLSLYLVNQLPVVDTVNGLGFPRTVDGVSDLEIISLAGPQIVQCVQGYELALMDYAHPVAQSLGLFHVVGGQQNCRPLLLVSPQ